MRKLIGALAAALLVPAALAATPAPETAVETLYVHAAPSVPLLATPSPTAVVIRELAPGDALTVVGREAGFVNVQAADGIRGWLSETDLSATPPPAARVAELEQEVSRLGAELAAAKQALATSETRLRQARQAAAGARESGAEAATALQGENAALREDLARALADAEALESRLAAIEADRQAALDAAELLAATQPPDDTRTGATALTRQVAAGLGMAILLTLLGAWLGHARARRRLRRRYHGLEL